MEAERKAMPGDTDILPGLHFHEKITYKVGTKVSIIGITFCSLIRFSFVR